MLKSIIIICRRRRIHHLLPVYKKELDSMNFYSKKFRRIASVVILVLIVAMVATMVIPYLVP